MNKLNKSIALKAVLPVLGLAFLLALSVGPAFAFADKDDRMMTDKDRDNVVAPTTVAPATYPYSYGYSYGASYPYSYGTSYSYPYSYGYSYPYSYGSSYSYPYSYGNSYGASYSYPYSYGYSII